MIGLVGYNLWRSGEVSDVTRGQLQDFYQLFNRQNSRSVYDRMTSRAFRRNTTADQFARHWMTLHKMLGPHIRIESSQAMLTFQLNPWHTTMQVQYLNLHSLKKTIDRVVWVKEDGYWKINTITTTQM